MDVTRKISALARRLFTRPAPVPRPVDPLMSYGVVLATETGSAYLTDPVFAARAIPVATQVSDILKAQGLLQESIDVSISALSAAADHKGVRFQATPEIARMVADALPAYIVIRSDCRVVGQTPKADSPQPKDCEIG